MIFLGVSITFLNHVRVFAAYMGVLMYEPLRYKDFKISLPIFFRMTSKKLFSLFIFIIILCTSCGNQNPQPIKLNTDNCYHCKMTVADLKFAAEYINNKGRAFIFDDFKCMIKYKQENNISDVKYFVPDYENPQNLIHAEEAIYVKGDSIRTPMNGYITSFANKENAIAFAKKLNASVLSWQVVNK